MQLPMIVFEYDDSRCSGRQQLRVVTHDEVQAAVGVLRMLQLPLPQCTRDAMKIYLLFVCLFLLSNHNNISIPKYSHPHILYTTTHILGAETS
jgi:hypothetical protein